MFSMDDEISVWWCLGDTWRCTPAEAIGLWLVLAFTIVIVFVTFIHHGIQMETGTDALDEQATQRQTQGDVDAMFPLRGGSLLMYILAMAVGGGLWVGEGVRWVHPVQNSYVQMVGVGMFLACYVAFVWVHVAMGRSWSPQPEVKLQHELVVHGPFRVARHPMYAVFLWFGVAAAVATLNWLLTLYAFWMFFFTMNRIPIEERILGELYGDEYAAYRRRVSALGPPWCCCFRGRVPEAVDARRLAV